MQPAMVVDADAVEAYLRRLQQRIVVAVEEIDGGRFVEDRWAKAVGEPLGGNGITCILEDGAVMERAGVGFSKVSGRSMPPSATQARPELAGRGFDAMGVSLVFHPRNPHAPTVHLNVRFFIARPPEATPDAPPIWWFGGGMDLTPAYGYDDDAIHFHRTCRDALAPFGDMLHPQFKAWCDRYFFLKHRDEMRGVGGIFFDDFNAADFDTCFAMMRSVGDAFVPAYLPILERRRGTPYGDDQRHWQALRRGRYVEFNLVFDRGTLFGLQSGGRTESILMSMPPRAEWRYDVRPAAGSPEASLAERYLRPREWI
ncbi:MAG: oxygen-dependent coproporphyrinogen oxidase [Burkholderiaceae bacterium]